MDKEGSRRRAGLTPPKDARIEEGASTGDRNKVERSLIERICAQTSVVWSQVWDFILRHALYSLSMGPLPRHIAFIMDGNRRWSRAQGLRVQEGHEKGFETLKRVLDLCLSLQRIEVVTVYAFAIDNFKRDASEVDALMELARTRLLELYGHGYVLFCFAYSRDFVTRHSLQIRVVGHRAYLPPSVQETARIIEEKTRDHTGYVVYEAYEQPNSEYLYAVCGTSRNLFCCTGGRESRTTIDNAHDRVALDGTR